MIGTVIKSTGSWYTVKSDIEIIQCKIRGKFRTHGIKTTNPVAVGDVVTFDKNEDGTGIIIEIKDRKNYLLRKSVNLSKQGHIIAANIDQLLLLITLENPKTYTTFIDRILINAQAYHIPVVLVFNKIDLYDKALENEMNSIIEDYSFIGYDCYKISAAQGIGLEEIKRLLKGKQSMMAGHSGSGKTTLINKIDSNLNLKTSTISDTHKSGKHTTTFAEMFDLKFGGTIIDTPGIKGFGFVDFEKEEVALYFREMKALLSECKFHNCKHVNEPKCAVKEAVEVGAIPFSRYNSYLSIISELSETDPYRSVNY